MTAPARCIRDWRGTVQFVGILAFLALMAYLGKC